MGNTDSIPVVSQVKSLVQVIAGDQEAAKKTQENFIRTGIIASQVSTFFGQWTRYCLLTQNRNVAMVVLVAQNIAIPGKVAKLEFVLFEQTLHCHSSSGLGMADFCTPIK